MKSSPTSRPCPKTAGSFCSAPLVELQKGTHADRLKKLKAEGFVRVRVATQGEEPQILNIDDVPPLDKNKKHSIDLVVDRLVIKDDMRTRLADSVELALRYGQAASSSAGRGCPT